MTGLLGFYALIAALVPSIVSVWLPGSPFEPFYLSRQNSLEDMTSFNSTSALSNSVVDKCREGVVEYTSVAVFLASIIAARTGLWIADLSVTQIMQVRKTLLVVGLFSHFPEEEYLGGKAKSYMLKFQNN